MGPGTSQPGPKTGLRAVPAPVPCHYSYTCLLLCFFFPLERPTLLCVAGSVRACMAPHEATVSTPWRLNRIDPSISLAARRQAQPARCVRRDRWIVPCRTPAGRRGCVRSPVPSWQARAGHMVTADDFLPRSHIICVTFSVRPDNFVLNKCRVFLFPYCMLIVTYEMHRHRSLISASIADHVTVDTALKMVKPPYTSHRQQPSMHNQPR